jgi:hypothetical protein
MGKLNTSLRIGLSRSSVTLLRTSGWSRPRREMLTEYPLDGSSSQQILEGLRAALVDASCAKLATTVVLADDWARLFMVTPPHNAEWLRDCKAAAALRFQSLYGEPPQDWTIDADWEAQHPFLACALPRSILGPLQQAGAERRLTFVSIMPQFVAAWNRWRRGVHANTWYGTMHADALTLGVISGRRLVDLRRLAVPFAACTDQTWLPEQIAREALRLALPVPERIHLCGCVPDAWITPGPSEPACIRLDAMPPTPDFASESAGATLAYTGARA